MWEWFFWISVKVGGKIQFHQKDKKRQAAAWLCYGHLPHSTPRIHSANCTSGLLPSSAVAEGQRTPSLDFSTQIMLEMIIDEQENTEEEMIYAGRGQFCNLSI